MRREGWAAAVGKVYLTRDGREVRLINYAVTCNINGQPECDLMGVLVSEDPAPDDPTFVVPVPVDYDEQGNVIATFDPEPPIVYIGTTRQPHPLDLVEAKLPAAWPVRAALEVKDDAKGESHGNQRSDEPVG